MQKLFTYGSLQLPHIQEKLFNRILAGTPDILPDYEKGVLEIEGKKFNVANMKTGSSIPGTVYDLSTEELERADRYEGNGYKRIRIILETDTEAWLYIRV